MDRRERGDRILEAMEMEMVMVTVEGLQKGEWQHDGKQD